MIWFPVPLPAAQTQRTASSVNAQSGVSGKNELYISMFKIPSFLLYLSTSSLEERLNCQKIALDFNFFLQMLSSTLVKIHIPKGNLL